MKIILHILSWGSGWLKEALEEELWEATIAKHGGQVANQMFSGDINIEIDGDYFIVSAAEVCGCCGKGSDTLIPCPQCGESLCNDCSPRRSMDGMHVCEPE